MNAFDERVMSVRPHSEQAKTAENVRTILNGSGIIEKYKGSRVQDALSLRCIPQLHGASKKTLKDAKDCLLYTSWTVIPYAMYALSGVIIAYRISTANRNYPFPLH